MIITLCGSARFEPYFKIWNEVLSLAGHCVFTLSVYPSDKKDKNWYTNEEKISLDSIHKQKIINSDAIFLINPFAYIGESTLSEIEFAKNINRKIFALEILTAGSVVGSVHTQERRSSYEIPDDYASPIDTIDFEGYWSDKLLAPTSALRLELMRRVEDWR